jgi:hypothetical protein
MKQPLLFLFLLLMSGCGGRAANNAPKTTPLERKIYTSIDRARMGEKTSPIVLQYRKLSISEIAQHLDMDEETAKKHLRATNVHGYWSIDARNLPPEGVFTLYHINYEGMITPGKKFFVNGNGCLVTKLDDQYIELSNNFLFFSNYLPGEPANFALISDDKKLISTIKIIPNPIERIDAQQHRVSVEIASADKRGYTVQCTGLKPYGSYLLGASFENEKFAYPFEANSKGETVVRTGPNTPWINGGEGSVELRGDGIATPLHIEFIWGS